MRISDDETRALAFIAALIALTALGRWVDRPRAVLPELPAADIAELARRSEAALEARSGGARNRGGSAQAAARGSSGRSSAAASAPRAPSPEAPLDINRATAQELELLPGVGPALAGRIVARRDSAGPFRTLAQLDSVRGIGPAMLARLKPLLRLER